MSKVTSKYCLLKAKECRCIVYASGFIAILQIVYIAQMWKQENWGVVCAIGVSMVVMLIGAGGLWHASKRWKWLATQFDDHET